MKLLKRLFFIFFGILFLLIVGGFVLTYFYKDELVAKVKSDINQNFNATIDFGSVDLSIFRSFPDFNFQLNDFSIVGQEDFAGVTLVEAKNIELDLDIMSVIKSDSPIKINTVQLNDPKVHVMILKDGRANYDIAKATEESDETYNFVINLDKYTINNGQVIYDDAVGDLYLELENLDHEGTGNFTQEVFDLNTKTKIQQMTVKSGGIKYLSNAKGDLDMTLNADLNQMKFTLKDNQLMVNALKLNADGFVTMLKNGDIDMDLTFDAPGNAFKNFLSLIPSAFTKDFQDVQANGQLAFNGYAKGIYSSTSNKMPAFKVFLDIKNGDFKYPTLPLGVKDIFANITVNSPSSNFDKMTVDVPNFKMNLGNNPFTARFNLKTPMSDPDIDTKMNGTINLADLAKAFPMEGVKTLNGVITADLTARTRMSYIDKQQYEKVNMDGDFKVENMNYVAEGLPPVNIKTMALALTPRMAKVENFEGQIGKSDLKARGSFDNILAYFSPEKTMTGDLVLRSDYFDVNEWIPAEEATENLPVAATSTEIFDRFDFNIDAVANKVDYDIYKLSNVSAKGKFTPTKLTLNNFDLIISNSKVNGNGNLRNVFAYVFEDQTLEGDLNMTSDFFDMNQFMLDMETATPTAKTIANEELEPLLIPDKIAVNINADVDRLQYTNLDLKNLRGKMVIANQAINFDNATANMLGGQLNMKGGYDTKNIEKPTFDMDMKVNQFKFEEAFAKLNTIKALAPIMKYIKGNFDTTLKLSGVLGKDMMPDLTTLSADGFLQTANAVIASFEPLQKLGEKLNINTFNTMQIKDTKNWFTVKDGFVNIQEFDVNYQDIAMKIGGKHGISQDMDYLIKAKIPRALLQKSGIGQAADKGLSFLSQEASKYGVNIAQGDFIDLNINILGSITSPQIKIKPVGSGGKSFKETATDQLNDIKDKVIDDAKDKVNEEVDKVKEAAQKKAEEELEKAKAKAKAELEKKAKAATDKAAQAVKDSIANALKDKVGDKTKDELDKLKDKWNPFGKKKEGGE